MRRLPRSLIGAIAAAMFAVGSVPSRGFELNLPPPPADDIPGSDALKAAPWLVCVYKSDADSGIRFGFQWNPNDKKFEVSQSDSKSLSFVLLFDDEKARAVLAATRDFSTPPTDKHQRLEAHPIFVSKPPRYALLLEIRAWEAPVDRVLGVIVIAISHARTEDGRFAAIVQTLSVEGLFTAGPDGFLAPLACAATADDALKQQIEKARAEWLEQPAAAPSGNSGQ